MHCPSCGSPDLARLVSRTELGYRRFRCRSCHRTFNERTGSPFNFLEYPTDLVFLVVFWRLRFALSLREVVEMCLLRGVTLTHETVRDWEQRFASYLAASLKKRRRGRCGTRWHVDETYIKVKGRWTYYYRAIDREGNLVDTMLSETRDKPAAIRFLRQAIETTGGKPTCVTTDKLPSYRKAVRRTCGRKVQYRTNQYLNNRLEQDHRGVKRRYGPMLGFKSFASAATFCRAFDETRQHFRTRETRKETISLPQQRRHFQQAVSDLQLIFLSCPVAVDRSPAALSA